MTKTDAKESHMNEKNMCILIKQGKGNKNRVDNPEQEVNFTKVGKNSIKVVIIIVMFIIPVNPNVSF